MIIAVGNDNQFEQFCCLLGCPEVAKDLSFSTNQQRVANRVSLVKILSDRLVDKTTSEWLALLESVGVPCGKINAIDETLNGGFTKPVACFIQVLFCALTLIVSKTEIVLRCHV